MAGVEALIGIYKTTAEAARVKANIGKFNIQAYQESVATHSSSTTLLPTIGIHPA